MRKVAHIVTRPGRKLGDASVDIPVPQDLATVPGIPQQSKDVDFYSREYPLQRQQVEHAADTEWAPSVGTAEMQKYHHAHQAVMEPFYALMGSVSKVELMTPMDLIYKALFLSISTFETPPFSATPAHSGPHSPQSVCSDYTRPPRESFWPGSGQ